MTGRGCLLALLVAAAPAGAADAPPPAEPAPAPAAPAAPAAAEGPKLLDGMSILGNQEAPKSLVIVPWKSSQLGASPGVAPLLDDSRQPVDREVFLRALSYYRIRSDSTRREGAPPGAREPRGIDEEGARPPEARRRQR